MATKTFYFFGRTEVLHSGLCACKPGALPLELHHWSILLWFILRWGFRNYLPTWPQTVILPISISQVARITGLSHQCPTPSRTF
jgi:hypothetical protein